MQLLYFANIRIPTEKAHGIQIMKMCEAFASHNNDTRLIVPKRLNAIKEDPFKYYGIKKNFSIIRLLAIDLLFLPFFKKLWFFIESVSFAKFSFAYAFSRVESIFYTRDVWIVFSLSFLKKPIFYEIHTLPKNPSWIHQRAWSKSKGLVVISNGLKTDLMGLGISEEKILVAPDAVDIDNFDILISKEEAKRKLNLPLDKKIILYTGHLYPWKGAHLLFEASKEFGNDFLFVFVGGTEQDVKELRIKNQACLIDRRACLSARQESSNVFIVGHRPHQEIPLWLKAADILILPTSGKEKIGMEYTSPMKLFEYMASGTPIIAADLPSTREVVSEKEVSFFIPDDPRDLASIIRYGIHNYDRLTKQAQFATIKVATYTWSKRAGDILTFIHYV